MLEESAFVGCFYFDGGEGGVEFAGGEVEDCVVVGCVFRGGFCHLCGSGGLSCFVVLPVFPFPVCDVPLLCSG